MRWLPVLLALVIAAGTAGADVASKKRADKLFEDGRNYLANGEYSLACKAFEESQSVEAAVGTQLNIALCYEKWGKLASAHKAYLQAERAARDARDKRSTVARKKADELEPKLAKLRVTLPEGIDRYAIYLLDADEIDVATLTGELVLDPGKHVVEVRVAGAPPQRTEVVLKAGKRGTLDIPLPPTQKAEPVKETPKVEPVAAPAAPITTTISVRSSGKLYGGIAMLAGGAIALGVGGYIALDARSDYNAAAERCPDGNCASKADYDATSDAKSRARAMTWVMGGGVALAAVGTFLIVTSKREVKAERLSIFTTEGGAGIAIGGSL